MIPVKFNFLLAAFFVCGALSAQVWVQQGDDIDGLSGSGFGASVALSSNGNFLASGGQYGNNDFSGFVRIYERDINGNWQQRGQDINGEAADDYSGHDVTLSSNGNVVAISAPGNDGSGPGSGHVRIYAWDETNGLWNQRGSDIEGEGADDLSGWSVSLSSQGDVVAIGAYQNDGTGSNSGHTRIYAWNGTSWTQRGGDIDGEAADDNSGFSVSLSSDGNAVAIGARRNDGNGMNSGHTRILDWDGMNWMQRGGDIDGEAEHDLSGYSVSLSADGTTVAIGATGNDGNGSNSGHVLIHDWDEGSQTWTSRGSGILGEAAWDNSGCSVSLSADGDRVAIGAYQNGGNGYGSGHARTFEWNGASWTQFGGDIDGEASPDNSGWGVSLASDGKLIAVGAPGNGSNSGHVRVYSLCEAPETPATAALFGTDSSTSLNITSFTAPVSGADGYAIYMSDANSFTPPSQGDEPAADASWNGTGQQAIYFGTSSSPDITVTDLSPGTQYYFQIYAYTDCSGTEVYEGTGLNTTDTTDPGELTITGLTGDDKEYDGTTDATASGTATLSGIVGVHDVSLSGTPTFTFASASAGTGIAITTTGYTLSGTDASKYTLTQPTLSADITMCPSPTGPATAAEFGVRSSNSLHLSGLTAPAAGADGYVVYMNSTDSFTPPNDGEEPAVDASWGDAGQQAVYMGPSSTPGVTVSGLSPSTGYYFHVYAYTDCAGYEVYETTSGLSTGAIETTPIDLPMWLQQGDDLDGESAQDLFGISVSLSSDGNVVAIGASGHDGNGSSSGEVRILEKDENGNWVPRGAYIRGEIAQLSSGSSVSLSADGSVIAIGANGASGNGSNSGHVRIYDWDGANSWIERGDAIDGEAAQDAFGTSVSLSSDGNIVAIGAPGNDGNGSRSGHVRIYTWDGSVWLQRGGDIDGEAADDHSGQGVSLASDGSVVAIGAYKNDGNGSNSGHARIYEWDGSSWNKIGDDIDGETAGDQAGYSVSLSSDGNVVAFGAHRNDDNGSNSGHVRVYEWDGTNWTLRGGDIDGEAATDLSGQNVSLSSDGNVVAIGAYQNDGNGNNSGHVRIYTWNQTSLSWDQQGADIDGEASDSSGSSIALSSDGKSVVIGAHWSSSNGQMMAGRARVYALCDAPETPATAAEFGTASTTSLNLASFTAPANGADGYAIYMSDANSFTPPSDGDEPAADASWNGTGQQAIYFGTSSSPDLAVTDLAPGTQYYFQIYAYNDCSGTEVYEGTGLNATATTEQGELTITGLTGDDKEYDGTTDATASGTATLSGIVGAHDVSLSGTPTFTFASADAGAAIAITTTGYTLSGTDASKYTLTQPTLSANITMCSSPTGPATAAVFGTGSTTSQNLASFTAPAGGADGYAIYVSDSNSFTPPNDGDEPAVDANWNGAGQQAIYFGTSSSPDITVTGLEPSTPYYFQVYAYTDCADIEVYEGTGLNATVSVCELLTVYDFMLLDTNAVNTFSITTQFNRALDSLSNHPLSPDVVNGHGFLDGHIIDDEVYMEFSIQQVVDSINALNGCE